MKMKLQKCHNEVKSVKSGVKLLWAEVELARLEEEKRRARVW